MKAGTCAAFLLFVYVRAYMNPCACLACLSCLACTWICWIPSRCCISIGALPHTHTGILSCQGKRQRALHQCSPDSSLFFWHISAALSLLPFLPQLLKTPRSSLGNSFSAAWYSKSVSPSATHSFYRPASFSLYKSPVPHLFIYCCASILSLFPQICSALPGQRNRMMINWAKQGKNNDLKTNLACFWHGPMLLTVICESQTGNLGND